MAQTSSRFIATEPLDRVGTKGEKLVWEAVRAAFCSRCCLGYWRYPIFSTAGNYRQEPDILLVDREWGLVVVEVKAIAIEQIAAINGHRWEFQDFYLDSSNPYQQAESQLFALLGYADREPLLQRKVTGRALVALPFIGREQWRERGFDRLPSNPPILFSDDLRVPGAIRDRLRTVPPLQKGDRLTEEQWELLLAVLAGTPLYRQPQRRVFAGEKSRGKALQQLRDRLAVTDLEREAIAKQIPPGCQRLRGIAGSGKTVLLCQKAAHMHLKYPQWRIAIVFFSRSLHATIAEQVDRWLQYFSEGQQRYDPESSRLQILPAWGGKHQPGFYSRLCEAAGVTPLAVNDIAEPHRYRPHEALAAACSYLLREATIPQLFDAILVDEGQDFIVDKACKFGNKQPFYWLVYCALRPVDPIQPEQRRLFWCYDEAQSLASLHVPTAEELFGDELGHLATGSYGNGIKKSEVLARCYRTPQPILTAAHALCMGWLRREGMVSGTVRQSDWQAIGYEVQGEFSPGKEIAIARPKENSPNPMPEIWPGELIAFRAFRSRQEELSALARNLLYNLRYDDLRPCREMLVVTLGSPFESTKLETTVAEFLCKRGIDIYLPGTSDCNVLHPTRSQRQSDRFWCEGAVTVSRLHRAKGQEADMVYVVGLDRVAADEGNAILRNQLFVALTRSRAWVELSGIGSYPFYEEVHRVLQSVAESGGDRFSFIFRRPPQRELDLTETGELLRRYAAGGRNFQHVNLQAAGLEGVDLRDANLLGAQLAGANLAGANLDGAQLAIADLRGTNLTRASLRRAKLISAQLEGAELAGADLTRADLSDADLTGANLFGADLRGANLSHAELARADLAGANLEQAILADA